MRSTSVRYAVPVAAAFAYLTDPVNRAQWQRSLRRVEVLDEGAPRVGQRWRDHTAVGMVAAMETTVLEHDLLWSETGRWRAIEADLTLRFAPQDQGCLVTAEFEVRGPGALRPLGWVATVAGLPAVRADLRQAGRLLESASS